MSVERIAEELAGLVVPIDSIRPHPQNARHGDVERIAESLTRFSQVKPVVVQASTRYVVAGNHVFLAAKSLGWKKVAAAVVELSDEDAVAYLLADNRTSDLGSYDRDALAEVVGQLRDTDALAGTGYAPDEADALIAERVKVEVDQWVSESFTSTLRFETIAQYERWIAFLNHLRNRDPDAPTMAARISAYIEQAAPDAGKPRPNSNSRGYDSAWRRGPRARQLEAHPTCQWETDGVGCGEPATDVDHRVPKRAGGTDDEDNLQSLCHSHHSVKTRAES
ncbi:MAG: hypothetical protein C0498_01505 [Anaerolinea sp.]|nr:hypothetical protein [Anaerolinea sp.]